MKLTNTLKTGNSRSERESFGIIYIEKDEKHLLLHANKLQTSRHIRAFLSLLCWVKFHSSSAAGLSPLPTIISSRTKPLLHATFIEHIICISNHDESR